MQLPGHDLKAHQREAWGNTRSFSEMFVSLPLNDRYGSYGELIDREEPKKPGQEAMLVPPDLKIEPRSRDLSIFFSTPQSTSQTQQCWCHLSATH